jgi:diguanylate cyclase (GGDEF)-like protein
MELRLYLRMLQRSWWIILLTALSALIIAMAAIYFVTPIFRSTASFVVSPNLTGEEVDQGDVLRSLEALDKRSIMATYAEVLNSRKILNATMESLGLPLEEMEKYEHATVVLPDANILELSVEGPDSQMTTIMANAMGQQAISYISQLYSVYDVSFMDQASSPTIPIRPQPVRDISLAFVLGLVFGAVLAIVREQVRAPLEAFLERTQVDNESTAYTRRYFQDRIDDITITSAEGLVSLGLVKLDGLDSYLQLLPQPMVQRLMRRITDVIRREVKGNDVIGRWDEDVFSILLPETPGNSAVSALGRVQLALSKPIRYSPDGETMTLTPKVGICERMSGDTTKVMIERATTALSQAAVEESALVLYKTRALVGF